MTKAEEQRFAALQAENKNLQVTIKSLEKLQREAEEASECIAYRGLLEIPEGTKVIFNNIEMTWKDNTLTLYSLYDSLIIVPKNEQKLIIKTSYDTK